MADNNKSWWEKLSEAPLGTVSQWTGLEDEYKQAQNLTNQAKSLTDMFGTSSSDGTAPDLTDRAKGAGIGGVIGAGIALISKALKHIPGVGFIFRILSNVKVSGAIGAAIGGMFAKGDDGGQQPSNQPQEQTSNVPKMAESFTAASTVTYIAEQTNVSLDTVKNIAADFQQQFGNATKSDLEEKSALCQEFTSAVSGKYGIEEASAKAVCEQIISFAPAIPNSP